MAKISGIYVEIRGDATQLKKELASARQAVTQQAHGMSDALNNALSPAQLKNSISGLVRNLNQLSQASKVTGKDFAAIGADLGGLQRLTGLSAAEFGKLQSRMMQTSAAKAQEQALRSVAKAAGLSADEVQRLGRQMGVSAGSIEAVNGAARSAASSADMLSRALGAALAYMSIGTVVGFARAVLDAGIAMDSLNRSFAAIAGNQFAAGETLAYLRLEAGRLGQNFYDLAPAFKSLSAAARGTVLEGEETRKIFSAVTAASTALGLSADQTKGTLLALEQMISKGVVSMEELRRQLGDRLPGAFGLAAKAMGVSTQELNRMVAAGEVMASDLLPKLAKELENVYGKAAQTAALESAQAAMNRMSQEWTDLKNNMFESDTAVAGINAVTRALYGLNELVTAIRTGRNASGEVRTLFDGPGRGDMTGVEGYSSYKGKVAAAGSLSRIRLADPRITGDSFIKMQGGMDQAAQRAAEYMQEVDKGREALGKYNQNAREKAKADYDSVVKFANSKEEEAKALAVYQDAIARLDKKESAPGLKAAKASAKSYEQMIEDGKKAALALDEYWNDYEDGRVKAVADGVAAREAANAKDLALVSEFADKYKEIVLGETEFKRAQIEAQADVYRKAGADEVAIAQWVEAEKLKVSREWSDGVQRGLADYADSATNAAQLAQAAITGGFKGMEDALVDFVKTGKLSFSELADSIISDMMRIMVQQSITVPLASGFGSMIGGLFGGSSPSVASVGDPKVGYAKGGVPGAPSLAAYANTIVSKPTIFPFAKGVGLMGEAGPEAIMPLKRGPDGTLGVSGGGSNVVVNVIESPGNGGQRQERQEGGTTIIDIMVEQIEAKLASNTMRGQGPLYSANKQAFGLTRAPGAY